jgi:hypothetical protein
MAEGRGVHEQLRAAADAVLRRWEVPPSPSGYLPFNALDDFEQRALTVFAEWLRSDDAQDAICSVAELFGLSDDLCDELAERAAAVLVGRVTEEQQ